MDSEAIHTDADAGGVEAACRQTGEAVVEVLETGHFMLGLVQIIRP